MAAGLEWTHPVKISHSTVTNLLTSCRQVILHVCYGYGSESIVGSKARYKMIYEILLCYQVKLSRE